MHYSTIGARLSSGFFPLVIPLKNSCKSFGNILYSLKRRFKGNKMPSFRLQEWNRYHIKIMPQDDMRYYFRFIPYFYGPICFDLAFWPAKDRDISNESIEYEWSLCRSRDDSAVKTGKGVIRFAEAKKYNSRKMKNGDVARHTKGKFSKVGAIDLGHMSILDQYKILTSFSDSSSNSSEFMIMMEFTLEDRDHYSLNIASVLLGAIAGAISGGVVALIVAIFTKGQ